MNKNQTLLALLLAAMTIPALADDAQAQSQDNAAAGKTAVHFDSLGGAAHGGRLFGMRNTVKNAPYSAQAVNERQQTLGDGNQISQRRDSSTWYRDSAGRTRFELRDAQGELRSVTISDPVAGSVWTLDPRKHSAFKMPLHRHGPDGDGAWTQARAEALRARIAQRRAEGGEQAIIVKRVDKVEGGGHTPAEVRIQVATPDGTLRDASPLGQALASALGDARWRKNSVTKDLGSKTFDGVKAEGKLRSYEIPAGEIGNRNPIVVSDETWTAPELQITVYTKHSDPRSGDTVFRLENLKRDEPAAALFSVPADYTVKDASVLRQKRAD